MSSILILVWAAENLSGKQSLCFLVTGDWVGPISEVLGIPPKMTNAPVRQRWALPVQVELECSITDADFASRNSEAS